MAVRNIKRRTFIENACMAALLAPVIHKYRDIALADAPTRMILVFIPNGFNEDTYLDGFASGTENQWEFGNAFSALNAYKQQSIAIRGFGVEQFIENIYEGEENGHGASKIIFTGHVEAKGTSGKSPKATRAPSIDQIVASEYLKRGFIKDPAKRSLNIWLGGSGWFDSRVFFQAQNYSIGKDYGEQECPGVSTQKNILEVYNQYFSAFKAPNGNESTTFESLWARGKSMLDVPSQQIKEIQDSLPAEGKQILDAHMTALRDLEKSLDAEAMQSNTEPAAKPAAPTYYSPDNRDNIRQLVEQWHVLIRNLFEADLVRIVTMQHGGGSSRTLIPELKLGFTGVEGDGNSGADHHSYTHYPVAGALGKFASWYADRHAHLLKTLKGTTGTTDFLNSSSVLWVSELGNGSAHVARDQPAILTGSPSGYFNTGRLVHLKNSGKKASGVLTSVCHSMGLTELSGVGHKDFATAALSELKK